MRVVWTCRPGGILPVVLRRAERRCGHVPDRSRASCGRLATSSAGGAPRQGRTRMTARPRNITFDCADPYRLAGFWSAVTGYGEDPDNSNEPDDPEALLVGPDGQANLLFIGVPEPKAVKNRVHLDLVPTDRS